MTTKKIHELQPLFCSRAALLQAQDKLTINPNMDCQMRLRFADGYDVDLSSLAFNDGLSIDDWLEWFKDCDRTKPLAIINFTKKRY